MHLCFHNIQYCCTSGYIWLSENNTGRKIMLGQIIFSYLIYHKKIKKSNMIKIN